MSSILSNISLNQPRELSTVPVSYPTTNSSGGGAACEQSLSKNVSTDRDSNKRKGMGTKRGAGGSRSRVHRTDSLAHVLGIRGNEDAGIQYEAKTLRGLDLVSEICNSTSKADRNIENRTMSVRNLDMQKGIMDRRSSKGS